MFGKRTESIANKEEADAPPEEPKIKYNNDISQAYETINRKTDYGELFYNNLSVDLQKEVTKPKFVKR